MCRLGLEKFGVNSLVKKIRAKNFEQTQNEPEILTTSDLDHDWFSSVLFNMF